MNTDERIAELRRAAELLEQAASLVEGCLRMSGKELRFGSIPERIREIASSGHVDSILNLIRDLGDDDPLWTRPFDSPKVISQETASGAEDHSRYQDHGHRGSRGEDGGGCRCGYTIPYLADDPMISEASMVQGDAMIKQCRSAASAPIPWQNRVKRSAKCHRILRHAAF